MALFYTVSWNQAGEYKLMYLHSTIGKDTLVAGLVKDSRVSNIQVKPGIQTPRESAAGKLVW